MKTTREREGPRLWRPATRGLDGTPTLVTDALVTARAGGSTRRQMSDDEDIEDAIGDLDVPDELDVDEDFDDDAAGGNDTCSAASSRTTFHTS